MRRSLLVVAGTAALCAALSAGACSGSTDSSGGSTSTAGSAVSDDPSVAWVDAVCGELIRVTETRMTPPTNLTGLSDIDSAQALKVLDSYVTQSIGIVDEAIADLRRVGSSPIAGADEALNSVITGVEALKKTYQSTKDGLAAVNATDPQAAQAAMLKAFAGLNRGAEELDTALMSIEANPAVEEAARKAPNCKKLDVGLPPTTILATTPATTT
jgi:hypothetical protein